VFCGKLQGIGQFAIEGRKVEAVEVAVGIDEHYFTYKNKGNGQEPFPA
jgi:hypothetical protein